MFFTENIAYSRPGVLIGYFIGNRLSIGWDKRKEYNEIIKPMYSIY
jgi:hypothetical protein